MTTHHQPLPIWYWTATGIIIGILLIIILLAVWLAVKIWGEEERIRRARRQDALYKRLNNQRIKRLLGIR